MWDTVLLLAAAVALGLTLVLSVVAGAWALVALVLKLSSHKERLDRLESSLESIKRTR